MGKGNNESVWHQVGILLGVIGLGVVVLVVASVKLSLGYLGSVSWSLSVHILIFPAKCLRLNSYPYFTKVLDPVLLGRSAAILLPLELLQAVS